MARGGGEGKWLMVEMRKLGKGRMDEVRNGWASKGRVGGRV